MVHMCSYSNGGDTPNHRESHTSITTILYIQLHNWLKLISKAASVLDQLSPLSPISVTAYSTLTNQLVTDLSMQWSVLPCYTLYPVIFTPCFLLFYLLFPCNSQGAQLTLKTCPGWSPPTGTAGPWTSCQVQRRRWQRGVSGATSLSLFCQWLEKL